MKKMRRAFGLIAAIFFIVLVATTAITALSIATMTARDTNNAHNREQAVLLAQSATEYAVLAMQKHQYPACNNGIAPCAATENCLETINITYPNPQNPLFNINVRIDYLDMNFRSACNLNTIGQIPLQNTMIDDPANPGNKINSGVVQSHQALIDVTVTSTNALGEPRIRYHRRTIQKP